MKFFKIIFLSMYIVFGFSSAKDGYCNESTDNPCCEGYIKVNISDANPICPPLCPRGCGEREICGSPNNCVCAPGFIGSDCDFPVELPYENDKTHCATPILQSYEVKKNWYCIPSLADCAQKKVFYLHSLTKHCCKGFIETSHGECVERR